MMRTLLILLLLATTADAADFSLLPESARSSLAAISMTTNTGCTTESNVECDLTFTVD
jgi:hypothetical protein